MKTIAFSILLVAVIFTTTGFIPGDETIITKNEFETLLKKTSSYFSSGEYSYKATYKSFIGHTSTKIADQFDGLMIRKGDLMFCKLPGNYCLQNEKVRLQVLDEEKEIYIVDPDFYFKDAVDWDIYETQMKDVLAIRRSAYGAGTSLILEMSESSEYEKQQIILSQTGIVEKVILFYREDISENQQGDQARLEVSYHDMKNSATLSYGQRVEDFVKLNGKQYGLQKKYSGFELIDYRFASK